MSSDIENFIKERQQLSKASQKEADTQENQDLSESLESKREKQELRHRNNKHKLAIGVYKKLFWAICVYVFLVLTLLTGNTHYFQIEDSVLIALLSTTTANILGVFYIASKWLYETEK